MTWTTGQALGTAICKALDLDPNRVSHLTLECSVGHLATVTAVLTVDEIEGDEIVTELKRYELHEPDGSSSLSS